MESKALQLRKLIDSEDLSFIAEAHNAISAKLVEDTGFPAIWASSLTISSALGVRDANEVSWTQILDVIDFMNDVTTIPVLADGDSGHGNFNNFRRLVRKASDRGVAGVCVEDKRFPKLNSFIGHNQALADIPEFCGKIRAGKDSQQNDDFVIVARTESLVSGEPLSQALERADAYYRAGADAVLVHSKSTVADEVLAFAKEWGRRCPLVLVPTTYYSTPLQRYREHKISTVIWANHTLRAAVKAMGDMLRQLAQTCSVEMVQPQLAGLEEVFALANYPELMSAERKYER
jgi:phosphoenolpyruvate phosphomutase